MPKITAFTDQITEIKCDVEGFPSPKIEWRRQGNKELPFDRHYIRNNNLYLRNPIKADEDIYMCHASNPAGSVMGGTEVTVQTYGEFVWAVKLILTLLHRNISKYMLNTVCRTFHKVLTGKICLTIKSLLSWWSFRLFSWDLMCDSGVILWGEIKGKSLLEIKRLSQAVLTWSNISPTLNRPFFVFAKTSHYLKSLGLLINNWLNPCIKQTQARVSYESLFDTSFIVRVCKSWGIRSSDIQDFPPQNELRKSANYMDCSFWFCHDRNKYRSGSVLRWDFDRKD